MRSPIRPQVIGFCLFTIWAFGTVYIFFQMRQEAMERFRSEAKSKKIGFTEGWILYPDNFSRDFLFRTMRDEYFEGLSDGRVVLTWIDPTRDEEIILWIHGGPRAIGNQTLIGAALVPDDEDVGGPYLGRHFLVQLRGLVGVELGVLPADRPGERAAAAGQCVQCHLGGYEGTSGVARLANQNYSYLRQTLLDYKNRVRTNAPDKSSLMEAYSDEELDGLAQLLSGQ